MVPNISRTHLWCFHYSGDCGANLDHLQLHCFYWFVTYILLSSQPMIPMLAEVSYSFGMLSDVCSKLKILMQGPLSTTFPIENRNVPVTAKALKNHLDRTKNLPFVKRISDFHLLLLLARFLDISADVPALAECVSRQVPVPDGYKLLIESVASSSWDDQVACEASDTNCRFQPNRSDEVKYQLLISSGDILGPRY